MERMVVGVFEDGSMDGIRVGVVEGRLDGVLEWLIDSVSDGRIDWMLEGIEDRSAGGVKDG